MTRALLPFDKRKVAKPRPRKAPLQKFSSIAKPSFAKAVAAAQKLRAGNRKRKAKNHDRAYGEWARVIRSKPCCVCGYAGLPSEAAHTATGGKGRKADKSTLVPLCTIRRSHFHETPLIEGCHRELHRIGVKSFESKYSVDLKAIAEKLFGERAE